MQQQYLSLLAALTLAGSAFAQGGDECATATDVMSMLSFPFDTQGATTSNSDLCLTPSGLDVWFTWTAPTTGLYRCSHPGTTNGILALYDGALCGATAADPPSSPLLGCTNGFFTPFVDFPAVMGSSYLIRFGVNGTANGPGTIAMTMLVDMDADLYDSVVDCDDSDPLVNPGATEIFGNGIDDNCDGVAEVDLDMDGIGSLTDCDDGNAAVFPGAPEICGNGIDEDCSGQDLNCPPANDDCAGATPLAVGANAVSTVGATPSGVMASGLPPFVDFSTPDTACAYAYPDLAHDVWYTFTPPSDGQWLFSTCNMANWDSKVAIYSGSCGTQVALACNDNGDSCLFTSELRATLSGGISYLVQVGAFPVPNPFFPIGGQGTLDISNETPTGVGMNYCPRTTNSVGSGTAIEAAGSASIALNNLTISVSNGPAGQPGVFFHGPSPIQIPFGNGNRCIGGSVVRLWPPTVSDGTGMSSRFVDNSVSPNLGVIIEMASVNFQYWHRDPDYTGMGGDGSGFNLSDALNVVFTP